LLGWAGLETSKYHTWKKRYGKANEHNGKIPRDWWLEEWEKQAILDCHASNPLEGYRRLTFMMLDDDIVAVSPSPYYPQSNGKLERWHGSIKQECIRMTCPATKEEAEKRVARYVEHYNTVRLHSAIGYITPADCLAGVSQVIADERDRKLEQARARRQTKRLNEKLVA
jgi:transposase InsO family protein